VIKKKNAVHAMITATAEACFILGWLASILDYNGSKVHTTKRMWQPKRPIW